MLKKPTLLGKEAVRYLLIASMTGLMVGCGGSSGDADPGTDTEIPIGEQDLDGDFIPNNQDDDSDNDGLDDLNGEDNFVDWDQDGEDDFTFRTQAEADAFAQAGTVVEVSAENPCGSDRVGTDNNSSTPGWEDNCVVKLDGQFATSYFAAGIQRVLYCSGFQADTSFPDYTGFADGIFGIKSKTATLAFQRAESLVEDGIVGIRTWPRLRSKITRLDTGIVNTTPDTYGFSEGVCAGIALFYQDISTFDGGLTIEEGGWTLARNQPDVDEAVPFSYEVPSDLAASE